MSAERVEANLLHLQGGAMPVVLTAGEKANKAMLADEKAAAEIAKAKYREAAVQAKAAAAKRLSDNETLQASARAARIAARRVSDGNNDDDDEMAAEAADENPPDVGDPPDARVQPPEALKEGLGPEKADAPAAPQEKSATTPDLIDLTDEPKKADADDRWRIPKSAKAKLKAKLGWMRVNRGSAAKGLIDSVAVTDAMNTLILDFSDEERPGGAIRGFPTAIAMADVRPDGPWWYAVQTVAGALLLVRTQGSALMVDTTEGGEHACSITIDSYTRDEIAITIADSNGFWGELFIGRSRAVASPEEAVAILTEQLRVLVTSAKWPRVEPGQPKNETKICFKALLQPGVEPLHPPMLVARPPVGLAIPMRYRLQADYFPLVCGKCHFPLESCKCAHYAAQSAERRDTRISRNNERRAGAAGGRGKGAGRGESSTAPRKTAAEKIQERREKQYILDRCKAQHICPFFNVGSCYHGADCKNKHEASGPTAPIPPLPAACPTLRGAGAIVSSAREASGI
jgi:hypothetical protein